MCIFADSFVDQDGSGGWGEWQGERRERKKKKSFDLLVSANNLKNIWELYSRDEVSSMSFSILSFLVTIKCHRFFFPHKAFKNDRIPNPSDSKIESEISLICTSPHIFKDYHI